MIRSMLRALWLLVALASLVTVACELEGCATVAKAVAPGGGVTAVAASMVDDLRAVRELVCTPKLDPFLGDPRADVDAGTSADAGGDR